VNPFLFLAAIVSAPVLGLLYEGIDRRLTARMHNRIGPPLLQPFFDLFKLLGKESLIPEQSSPLLFSALPALALASALFASLFLPPFRVFAFSGDVLVLLYFLVLGSLALIFSGFASGGPFAGVGALRAAFLFVGFEFPLVAVVFAVSLSAGSLSLSSFPGGIMLPFAFLGFVLSAQAKLMRPPFHIPDADTELVGGIYTEFSGTPLAVLKLAHAVELFLMVSFGVALFFTLPSPLFFFAYSALFLFLSILMKVALARIRVDQSFAFFWFLVAPLVLVDLVRVLLF